MPRVVAGPKAWNSLPSELRCIAVDSTFRRRLKAELFSQAYGVSINISSGVSRRGLEGAVRPFRRRLG